MAGFFGRMFGRSNATDDLPSGSLIVETKTWRLTFPEGWMRVATQSGKSEQVVGPDNNVVTIQTAVIAGRGSETELHAVTNQLEQMGTQIINKMQQGSNVVQPMTKSTLRQGGFLISTLAHAEESFLAQYVAVNRRVMLLVTHEGPLTTEGYVPTMRNIIHDISWL